MSQATVTLTLGFDKRGCRADEFSVKLCIYRGRGAQRMYSTGVVLQKDDVQFLKKYLLSKRKPIEEPDQRLIWQMLYEPTYLDPKTGVECIGYLKKGQEIIDFLGEEFDPQIFKKYFTNYEAFLQAKDAKETGASSDSILSSNNVINALLAYRRLLLDESCPGTANLYRDTASSLTRYWTEVNTGSENGVDSDPKRALPVLTFESITSSFLKKYEKWMYKKGKSSQKIDGEPKPASPTTVSIYTRNIRTVYNLAIDDHVVEKKFYPFNTSGNRKRGRRGFTPPSGSKRKQARKLDLIKSLVAYDCPSIVQERRRDLWIFSYYGNGCNFADILRLRWGNIEGDQFSFIRQKSRTTRNEQSKIVVHLNPVMHGIIQKWGSDLKGPDDFVFPILTRSMDVFESHKVTKQYVKQTNIAMKRIAAKIGVEGKLTTYVARHSFSTIMAHAGVPILMISEMLGHASVTTTQNYLDSFEDETVKDAVKALVPESNNNSFPSPS